MKLKKLIALILALALCAALAACGGENPAPTENNVTEPSATQSEDTTQTEEATEAAEFAPIPMTDEYTFTDPTDLEFDTRYVYVGSDSCKLLSDMKNFGYQATAMYEILYTKDDAVAGEYQYFVCEDEAMASDLAVFFQGQGQNVQQEGAVLYAFSDADSLLAMIMMFEGMNVISDESPESYLKYIVDSNGLEAYSE